MIVFFSNFLNHHQVLLCDALYEATNHSFCFVALYAMPDSFKKNGYPDFSDRPYLLKAYENEDSLHYANELAINADVALFGSASLNYEVERARVGKIAFEVGERWFKRGWMNLFSPRLLKNQWHYHTLFHKKPIYRLCSSAYALTDLKRLHSFEDKCYKWGYFTMVDDSFNVEESVSVTTLEVTHLLWCARFISWKHPEMPVRLASLLKAKGYSFVIDMYGSGEKLDETKSLAKRLGVEDVVKFCGNRPNADVLSAMREYEIFLFTSDRNEGWGAVLNEAMSNGCAVVASDEIGSVPYLIENGKNGLVFQSKNLDSLFNQVSYLLNNPNERGQMAIRAYYTIKELWSPKKAAHNLLQLIDDLQHGREVSVKEGPCSKAKAF